MWGLGPLKSVIFLDLRVAAVRWISGSSFRIVRIETGVYSSTIKLAKVNPIFKSNDESDPNYRPISLVYVFNRIFEKKKVYYRLKSLLEQHNTLHDTQCGFREKRSTEHALLDI